MVLTALQDVCVCRFACLHTYVRVAIYQKFKLMINPSLSNSTPMDLQNVTEGSSPCNSMLMNLLSASGQIASGVRGKGYC